MLVVYRAYVGDLSRAQEASLWADYRVVGELFGLAPAGLPATLAAVNAYRTEMLEGDRLLVTDWARERAREIVLDPPVPLAAKPLVEAANSSPSPCCRSRSGPNTGSRACRRSSCGGPWSAAAPST